ncbi:hypothetical protein [Streptomyces sp. NBC_00009]|uniref:hypothetical protein n=1 Tax=Streptomyces sp. NBC_00009 TaxID=2975620 RepID=UPI00324A6CE1
MIFLVALLKSPDSLSARGRNPHVFPRGETLISAESYIGSSDFWNTVITVFVTVVAALLAAWATLRSVNPRRRLVWRQHVNSNLFRDAGAATAIGVSYGQSVVSEPRLVELLVKNAGRRDLQSSDFVNADNSLVFDFGVPVVAVLNSAVQPPTAAPSVTSHTGSELRIHPGLIAKRPDDNVLGIGGGA